MILFKKNIMLNYITCGKVFVVNNFLCFRKKYFKYNLSPQNNFKYKNVLAYQLHYPFKNFQPLFARHIFYFHQTFSDIGSNYVARK